MGLGEFLEGLSFQDQDLRHSGGTHDFFQTVGWEVNKNKFKNINNILDLSCVDLSSGGSESPASSGNPYHLMNNQGPFQQYGMSFQTQGKFFLPHRATRPISVLPSRFGNPGKVC